MLAFILEHNLELLLRLLVWQFYLLFYLWLLLRDFKNKYQYGYKNAVKKEISVNLTKHPIISTLVLPGNLD